MSTKTAKAVFLRALAIIRDPSKWTQGTKARDSYGRRVGAMSPDACKFCSIGAVYKAGGGRSSDLLGVLGVLDDEAQERGWLNIIRFNDASTHTEVVALWERAGKRKGWL